jgi:DNA-binding IclR family transcriptional regulator
VGLRAPIHAGASCKALLAYQPHTELERVIREVGLARLTPFTITDPDKLHEELAEIRRKGYAISLHEVRLEHIGIGAPVFDYRARVVAAISIAGPADRFPPERIQQLTREVLETAREASYRLGFPAHAVSGTYNHMG